MAYRKLEKPRVHKSRRTFQALTTPFHAWVINGSSVEIAIPCFYQEVRPPIPAIHHDIHWHHHVGWPGPYHPDHICQMAYTPHECGHKGPCKSCRHYLDMSTIHPIHLNSGYEVLGDADAEPTARDLEGRLMVVMSIDDRQIVPGSDDGPIEAEAWVDDKEDWIVRIAFHTCRSEYSQGAATFSPFSYDIDRPVNVHATVFFSQRPLSGSRTSWKALCHGIVTILPSAIEYNDESYDAG